MTYSKFSLFVFILLLVSNYALAQSTTAQNTNDKPLEISAQNSLEWDEPNQKYYARGGAVAKQGTSQIEADILEADYREKNGQTEIYHLKAKGNVVLISGENKAYGDEANYDIDAGKAILTGKNLRMVGPDMTVTATERFEYFTKDGRITAVGNPVITNKGDTLSANKITAWTAKDTEQKSSNSKMGNLKRAEAEGNVVIKTPKEQAKSDNAIYDGGTDTTHLNGDVELTSEQNKLTGDKAEMNMTSKVSKVFGKDTQNKTDRVKGTFLIPEDKSK